MSQPAKIALTGVNQDGTFTVLEAEDVSYAEGGGGWYVWLKTDDGRKKFFLPMHAIDTIEFTGGGVGKSDVWEKEKKEPAALDITAGDRFPQEDEPITLEVQDCVIGTTSTTP